MKKVLAVVAAVGCLAAASASIAGIGAGSGVNGSLHDMTVVVPGTADSMGRVCVYCHTPHHATVTYGVDELPLWNHTIPTQYFKPYVWATEVNEGDKGVFNITDPLRGPSRLCMSCHDGAIAVDQHGEAFDSAGSGTNGVIGKVGNTHDGPDRANLGSNDLSNTHPIGFDYNAIATWRNDRAFRGSATAGGATEIVPSTYGFATDYAVVNTQGTYNDIKRNGKKPIVDTLYEGKWMTCATCHEVHNKENATQREYTGTQKTFPNGLPGENQTQSAPNYFLYAQQWQSLICLSCHVK